MTPGYRSNLAAVEQLLDNAIDAGLVAAVQVPVAQVKRNLRGGYTTCAFSHGGAGVQGSVTWTTPVIEAAGWVIRFGTDRLYALFWEIGHNNIFTRKYERVEIWMPALMNNAERIRATFDRA